MTTIDVTTALDSLETAMTGPLVRPEHEAYDDARSVWNGMIDLRPAAIARCATTADVQAVVRASRETGLELAVRGGGHNVAGFGTSDGGLVLDLSPMRSVRVDPGTQRAHVAGGATLLDLDAATQAHGRVVPAGVVSETGVAGLTLSGGLGWVRRRFGLSCDNLVGVELVTAAGDVLRADDESDPELMWGLRGGGGNFGVVTELVFETHAVGPEVAFLFVLYPLDAAHEVLAGHERLVLADDAISTIAVLGHVPPVDDFPAELHGVPYAALVGMYAGPAGEGEEALRPLRDLAQPLADFSGPMTYVEAQQVYDPEYPKGHRYYWKSTNLPGLPADVVDVLVAKTREMPSKHSTIDIWLNGGAIARVADDATAFSGRQGMYVVNPEANWEVSAEDDANVAWARGLLAALTERASGGSYLNFPGFLEEGTELVRASYGENHDRLAALKRRLDPENLFRRNANVAPA